MLKREASSCSNLWKSEEGQREFRNSYIANEHYTAVYKQLSKDKVKNMFQCVLYCTFCGIKNKN